MNPGGTGRIITFYSYKGGTGRSMALANVGWILASLGEEGPDARLGPRSARAASLLHAVLPAFLRPFEDRWRHRFPDQFHRRGARRRREPATRQKLVSSVRQHPAFRGPAALA